MKKLRNGCGALLLLVAVIFSCLPKASAQSYVIIPSDGPFVGGNMVVVTNTSVNIGNGSDITNLTVGGVSATRTGQGMRWVAFVSPAIGEPGVKDVVIQSTSRGNTTLTNAYTYHPAGYIGPTWTEVAGLPTARYSLAVGGLNGALYALGGYNSGVLHTNVYRYNGTNWTEVAGLPGARDYLAAGSFNGALYAIGGNNSGVIQTNVYRYNGTNWTEVAGLPTARYSLAVGELNGALYAIGGNNSGVPQTNVYRYCIAARELRRMSIDLGING